MADAEDSFEAELERRRVSRIKGQAVSDSFDAELARRTTGEDPPKEIPQEKAPEKEESSTLEALLRGGASGLTLGFNNEINALLDPVVGWAADRAYDLKHKPGTPFVPSSSVSLADQYRESRNADDRKDDEAKDAHWLAFNTGKVGGSVVASPLLGSANGLKAGAALGAKLGGVAGLGNSRADLTQGDTAGQAATDIGVGALAGAAGGLVPGVVDKIGLGALNKTRAIVKLIDLIRGQPARTVAPILPGAGQDIASRLGAALSEHGSE